MTANERSDEELYRAMGGDADALSALRSRYTPVLYDFALRVSLDPGVASSSVRAVLDTLPSGDRPAGLSISTWLLSALRDDVLERMRNRAGGADGAQADLLSPADPRFSLLPPDSPADAELAAWAWQAARAQRPRDYSLLDMSVRRGLPADEIAEATDMSHSGIYAILGRLRGFFEEGFAATLLYYRGRDACPDMAAIAQSHGSLGPAVRREIARHVEGCSACRRTRRSFTSPADLLAQFVPLEAPEHLFAVPASGAAPGESAPSDEAATPAEEAVANSLQGALPLAAAAVLPGGEAEASGPETEEPEPAEQAAEEEPLAEPELVAETSTTAEAIDEPEAIEPGEVEEPELEEDVEAGLPAAKPEPPLEAEVPVAVGEIAAVKAPALDEAETIAFSPGVSEEAAAEDEEEFEEAATGAGGEGEDIVEGELVGASALPVLASTVAVDAAQDGPVRDERIQFARDRFLSGMGGPPRRPWDQVKEWFEGRDPARIALIALFVGALGLAVYLGLALGDSIEGGNGSSSGSGLAALPTSTPGVRQIVCGAGPSTLDQGSKVRLDFDKTTLAGYQVRSDVAIQPVSQNASAQAMSALAVPPLSLEIEARAIPGNAARTDEYKVLVTFTKAGEPDIRSECTVLVKVPAVPVTPSAVATTPAATATATQRPAATSAPPTAIPPTDTPVPSSPTPQPTVAVTSTPTRTATVTPTKTPGP